MVNCLCNPRLRRLSLGAPNSPPPTLTLLGQVDQSEAESAHVLVEEDGSRTVSSLIPELMSLGKSKKTPKNLSARVFSGKHTMPKFEHQIDVKSGLVGVARPCPFVRMSLAESPRWRCVLPWWPPLETCFGLGLRGTRWERDLSKVFQTSEYSWTRRST